jgi:putative PIN family toxin of toxin-antitoxin system
VVISLEILREYMRVGEILSKQFQDVNITPFLELLATNSEIILAPSLPESVSDDPDDDKFIACAIAGDAEIIISGDRDLIKIGEHKGVKIVTPRKFVDEYL